ncbi:MAG: hypothetical protein U1D30_03915 [Planctomycetota bacterium]
MRWNHRQVFVAALLAAATMFTSSGCLVNVMALPYFLFAGEPTVKPPVKLLQKRRDEKKVLVLGFADPSLKFGFDAVDDELTGLIIGEIMEKEKRLEVIPERKVRGWRDTNPHWTDKSLQEIGENFDVDYVIFFEVSTLSLNETKNQYLLQGKTKVIVKIHDVNKDAQIFNDTYQREYPPERAVPLTDFSSEEQFRRLFLRTIAREISWYVVPHRHADEISDI